MEKKIEDQKNKGKQNDFFLSSRYQIRSLRDGQFTIKEISTHFFVNIYY